MSEQPREIDRARVLNELVHRWDETAGASGGEEPGASWVLDQLEQMGHLAFRQKPLCGASEGMTGIPCGLPKGHVMPDGSLRTVHEGTTSAEMSAYVGYETFVRWPVSGTALPRPAVDEPAGCQNHWPTEPEQETRPLSPDEARLLLVHPSVWKSLENWLSGMHITVDREPGPVPAFGMSLIDGEWGE